MFGQVNSCGKTTLTDIYEYAVKGGYTGTKEEFEMLFSRLVSAPIVRCGTEEVADGSASPYPVGTIYVMI